MRPGLRRGALGLLLLAAAAGLVYAATRLWHTTVPGDLALPRVSAGEGLDPRVLDRARSYSELARWLDLGAIVTQLVVLGLYARRGAAFVRLSAAGPIGTGFLLGMLGVALVWLAQFPFKVASLWWAKDHGVVKVDWFSALFGDWFSLAGQFVFLCFALLVAMGFARLLRRTWFVPAAAVFAGLVVLFAFIGPWLVNLDQPRASLRSEAADVALAEGVGDIPLRVEKVRDVTTSPNAYSFGIGPSRRVVLWDTIARFPPDQVRVTLAHEYAHQASRHIPKTLGWFALLLLPAGLLVMLFTRRRGGLGVPEAVPVALFVVVVLQLVATPLQNAVSRRYEVEADWQALQTTRDPRAMEALFRHFVSAGLADPDPPGWYHALFDNHPSGVERIALARAWAARHR